MKLSKDIDSVLTNYAEQPLLYQQKIVLQKLDILNL